MSYSVKDKLLIHMPQSVYPESFGTGYKDVNDAERLSLNPVMRVITGKKDNDKQAASSNKIGRFETEILNQWENNAGHEWI